MNLCTRLLNTFCSILFLSLTCITFVQAEGTKELSPTAADSLMLHTNIALAGYGNFGSFGSQGTASSINLRVTDHTLDSIYIGVASEANGLGAPDGSTYQIRLRRPDGTIAFTYTVNPGGGNASSWLLASNGPDVNGTGGYSTNTAIYPWSRFDPDQNGDWTIEFFDGGTEAFIPWFDFTIRRGGVPQTGRLWSRNWVVRSPQLAGPGTPPECVFNREFNGVFYSYTMDGFVSRIDFNGSGFQGFTFAVAFGNEGPGMTGDILEDRRSIKGANATLNNAEHMVFVNDPDPIAFPSSTMQCGEVDLINVQCISETEYCITVGVTQPGLVELVLDFNNNGVYDENSTDVLLAMNFTAADTACLMWDGLMGDGNPIPFGQNIPTNIKYSQGIQHYAAFDVEFLKDGFCVETVRPICPGVSTDLLYWDDTHITDNVATGLINEGDPGTGQPKVQLNGCSCGIGGCRTWTTFDCTMATTSGYGDANTLNTWWYASTFEDNGISLPFAQVNVTGDSAICAGTTTEFFADYTPDTTDFVFAWEGPGGFTATTESTGPISTAGFYYVTITDPATNCIAFDSLLLIVNANPTTTISFTCLGPNQPNANVDLGVSGGTGPYTYLWSNGITTMDLTNVGPGEYSVIVTDANGCQAFDTIVVEGCCELVVVCPPSPTVPYTCLDLVPVASETDVVPSEYCTDYTTMITETDNGGAGCPDDTLEITRTYLITDDAGNTASCVIVIQVVDNVAPVLETPLTTANVLCTESTSPDELGQPVFSDNCSDVILTFDDDSTGFVTCVNDILGTITRTFTATDDCGNTTTHVQTINVIDNVPPTFDVPASVTIECDSDITPATTGSPSNETDNCLGPVQVGFTDLINPGVCPVRFIITRTWTATDNCGNTTTANQSITLIDTVPPTFTVPDTLTLDCGADLDPSNTGQLTDVDDNCGTVSIDYSDLIVQDGCPVNDTVFRTWIVSDDCGNSATGLQVILRLDTEAPTFTTPADTVLDCGMSTDTLVTGSVDDAVDNCSEITISFSDVVVAGECPGIDTTFRTWVVSDNCNNSSTGVQVITRVDTIPPDMVFCPADVTIECTDDTSPDSLGEATATDECDAEVDVEFTDIPPPAGCSNGNPLQRIWTATDDCGNTATCIQLIQVSDTEAPTFTVPADLTLNCDDDNSPEVAGYPSEVSDNCGPVADTSFTDEVLIGNCTPFADTVLRTWVVTDLCGNTASETQLILRVDLEAPTFTVPPQITIACDQDSLPSTTGMVTDTLDNCSFMTVDFSDLVLPNGCDGQDSIVRTWVVTDRCGNSSTALQYILRVDLVAPTFTAPADTIIDCGVSTEPESTGDVTDAEDNCSLVAIDFSDVVTPGTCPALTVITRTWIVSDVCDNFSTAVQIITVQDTTGPSFIVPADITIDCELDINDLTLTGNVSEVTDCGTVADTTYSDAVAVDGCDGTAVLERTWVVADLCGNTSTGVQILVVQDTLAPDIEVPADITISCEQDPTDLEITGDMIVFLDNCSMMFEASFTDNTDGLTGCNGTGQIIRTWLVDDECDNAAEMQQIITIVDNTPPTAVCQNIVLDFNMSNEITILPEDLDNGSSDLCGAVTLAISQSTFTCEDFATTGEIPVTLTVTDECGNTSTCIALVQGMGGILSIECPQDIVVYLDPGECVSFVNYTVTADAVCGGAPELIQTDGTGLTSGDAFPIGTTIQTWIATNGTGSVECSFTITVIEWDGPVVMACNDTINVSVDQNCEGHIFVDMILEGDQYGCYDDFIISIDVIGQDTGWIVFPAQPWINDYYTVTITDPESGNSCWGTVLIEDKIAPQILCVCPPGDPEADTCEISCLAVDQLLAGNIPPALYPQVIDNCENTVEIADIDLNDEGCGEGTVIVTWQVTDSNNNSTATCQQLFNILPLSPDSLVFPPNYVGECGSSSHPDVTGWPTIGGYELTDEAGLCNLYLGYWDKPLDDCGGGSKILRTWTILDWCTLELIEATQIIKLTDDQGPDLICPSDVTVGTDFWYCHASVSLQKPIANDDCTTVESYVPSSETGVIVSFGNNFIIQGLELGDHVITWTVTDACGNSSTCTYVITVIDDVVPVVNCDHHTVVSLTNDGPNGITLVPASVFDDGSYDNCGPVTFRARRMDSCIDFDWTTNGSCIDDIPNGFVNSADDGTSFKPCVPFACCDVPRTGSRMDEIMVQLEVTDAAGNVNYCMVIVEVQDKISPFVECPPDISVSCEFWFPIEEGIYRDATGNNNGNLDEDPLSLLFGNMHDALANNLDESVRQPIIINDPGNDNYPQPHTWGIDGWSHDNCLSDLEVRVVIYDDCTGDDLPGNAPPGAVKLVERRFVLRDNAQGLNPTICIQRIWVVDFNPFYIDDTNCNNSDRNDGVIWPCDVLITSCPDDLGNTGEPTIFSDACNLIGVTFEDTRFEFTEGGACFKILREWKVIDWCQYDPVTGYGLWSYTQVIKVHDEDGAEFVDCPQNPVTLCVEDEGIRLPANNQAFLGENDPNSTSCSVHVTIEQRVREACNNEVAYDVKIYPFNGTSFLQVVPRTIAQVDENGEAVLVFNTEESALQEIRRNGLPYNSPECGSYHRILWSVEDGCGNWSHCDYLFRLEDCKQPSPVCINGLSTVVMPIGCQITLWAKDFNASSFDDCTSQADLLYSFSGDTYEPSRTFHPDNIPAFNVELSIQIWVADGGNDDNCNGSISWDERNKDFCTTTILFTDNSDNCDGSGPLVVYEGSILTDDGKPVEQVKVDLFYNQSSIYSTVTPETGEYVILAPAVEGRRYDVTPSRLDNPKNGISTLDLLQIQKHLLGIQQFTSPFQFIAADANNNQGVSAVDLIEIRKLILGKIVEFPNNTSWRFVAKEYLFPNPQNPWPFQEKYNIQYNGLNMENLDFVGVKVGDLNHSVQANLNELKPRSGGRIVNVQIEGPQNVKVGETVKVKYIFTESVNGFQWTLQTPGLDFVGITEVNDLVGDDNIALHNDGSIAMSWNRTNWSDNSGSQVSFELEFIATQSGDVLQMMKLSDDVAETEAYTLTDEVVDIKLSNRSEEDAFALYQNEPNPWNGSTRIGFDLPGAGKATLTLYDMTGKMIKIIEIEGHTGFNQVEILKKDVNAQGVLYYRLDAGNYTATKKMIRIE